MKLVKKISIYGNRSPSENTWTVIVKFMEGKIEIYFFRPTPFCKDGYKNGMAEILASMGWEFSMGMSWKEGLSPEEFVDALNFVEAYAKVYEREVEDVYADIPLTLQEFLNLVEKEKETEHAKKDTSIYKVTKMLTEKGFKAIKEN